MDKFKLAIILTIGCVLILLVIYFLAERYVAHLRLNIRGRVGESVINRLLSSFPSYRYTLIRGVLLQTSKGNVQIDHVLVSTYGIFIIESFDWGGSVCGRQDDIEWTHRDSAGVEHTHFNPLAQNSRNVNALQELLGLGYDDFISILAFVSAVDLDVSVNIPVANINTLTKIIKSYKDKRFTHKQMLYLANEIKTYNMFTIKDLD